jgi:hypothetical protein
MRFHAIMAALLLCPGPSLTAQASPYLFVASPSALPLARLTAQYDMGLWSDRWQTPDAGDLSHNLAIAVPLLPRLSLAARGYSLAAGGDRQAALELQAEWRLSGIQASSLPVALRIGARRETGGAGTLLGGMAFTHRGGRLDVGVDLGVEHPLAAKRDAADVSLGTALGYSWRPGLRLCLEFEAEDVEGLWEHDAEGGARAFLGPTIVFGLPGHAWTLLAGGGPLLVSHPTQAGSTAIRQLGTSTGYVLRAGLRLGDHP